MPRTRPIPGWTWLTALLALAACGEDGTSVTADGGPDGGADAGSDAAAEVGPLPPLASRAWIYAGGSNRIDVFSIDTRSAAVSLHGTSQAGDDARLVDVDPRPAGAGAETRLRAYVQTQMGQPFGLLLFEIDPVLGTLVEKHQHPLPFPGVEGVTQIGFHPTARWFMVSASNRDPGLEDHLMALDDSGRLGPPRIVSYDFYGFTWDPGGNYFYGLDGEAIFQHGFDPQAGSLSRFSDVRADGSSGRVVLSLRPHPSQPWVYSVEESELGLYVFDAASGRLAARSFAGNPVPGEAIYWTAARVHPSGRFLYVLGYLSGSRLALVDVFAIDAGTGQLRFVERQKGGSSHGVQNTGLQSPLLLPDLLVIGGPAMTTSSASAGLEGSPVLVLYRIRESDGTLSPVGAPIEMTPALKPAVSFLFAASPSR